MEQGSHSGMPWLPAPHVDQSNAPTSSSRRIGIRRSCSYGTQVSDSSSQTWMARQRSSNTSLGVKRQSLGLAPNLMPLLIRAVTVMRSDRATLINWRILKGASEGSTPIRKSPSQASEFASRMIIGPTFTRNETLEAVGSQTWFKLNHVTGSCGGGTKNEISFLIFRSLRIDGKCRPVV